MLKKFFQNTRKPKGLSGKLMAIMMNRGHAKLSEWGFSHLKSRAYKNALDVGCGGGANVNALLGMAPGSKVCGIDYSDVCVKQSSRKNQAAIDARRCRILQASARKLPFPDHAFDLVTAFETVYFWQDLVPCFREVFRTLKPGGTFLVCNEDSDASNDRWAKLIDGMTVYELSDLKEYLQQAGFCQITADQHPQKGWICLTAQKPGC